MAFTVCCGRELQQASPDGGLVVVKPLSRTPWETVHGAVAGIAGRRRGCARSPRPRRPADESPRGPPPPERGRKTKPQSPHCVVMPPSSQIGSSFLSQQVTPAWRRGQIESPIRSGHPGDKSPGGERRSCPIRGDTAPTHLMNHRGVFGLQRLRAEYGCPSV